jgi:hypothetical protein
MFYNNLFMRGQLYVAFSRRYSCGIISYSYCKFILKNKSIENIVFDKVIGIFILFFT